MATDDVTEISSPCLCGRGKITVTQTMPDHPWVRDSQISYTARLDCEVCSETFEIQHDYHKLPSLVRREDAKRRKEASDRRRAAEKEVLDSPEAARLIPRIVSAIDSQASMAARHRTLQRFRLSYESLGTYRKRPYRGEEAVRGASGGHLAEIGSDPALGGADVAYFKAAAKRIEALEGEESSLDVKPVKTGARWMRM